MELNGLLLDSVLVSNATLHARSESTVCICQCAHVLQVYTDFRKYLNAFTFCTVCVVVKLLKLPLCN